MSGLGEIRARTPLALAFLLGAFLLLSCQPTQPAATPKPAEKAAEKAAAAPTKPAEKAAEKPVRGGTLRMSLGTDASSLDAHVVTAGTPSNSMYDLLIEPDIDGNVTKEGLFKDWTISGDGKAIIFKQQQGVKFHDGTDFDAAAVKYNIERMKDPATKSPYAFNYAGVEVQVVDNLTVRFNLKQPDPLLLSRLATQGGRVVSPAAVQKYGEDFGRKPVGSGPFQFVEWVPGDRITMKRFAGYWGKDKVGNQLPYLDQVVMQIITDPTAGFANLRTGQIDVYSPPSASLPSEQLPVLKADSNLTYASRVTANIRGVYLNTKRPPFDNKALRQAVALALDREGQAGMHSEMARPYASLFHPMNLDWGADPKIGVFPSRDLAKAKAKMVEAGYPSGGLKMKLLSSSAPTSVRESEILKANLAEIGIEAEIEVVASNVWNSRAAVVEVNYQITPGATGVTLPDPGHIFSLQFHSKGTRNTFGPYGNPKVDELLDKAGSIYDQKERTAFYQQAAQLIVDDVPFVSVYQANTIIPMTRKVRDYPLIATSAMGGFGRTWLAQ